MTLGKPTHRKNSIAAVAASVSLLAAVPHASAQGNDPRPNIIYLMTDDQRADAAGFMGNSIIQTPHLDTLANGGVVFDQAFVTTAICAINRANVFTGQYAARHGILKFVTNLSQQQLAQSYPALLSDAGYYTGFVGKWGVGSPQSTGIGNYLDYNKALPGAGHYNAQRDDGSAVHLTTLMAEQATEFLDQAAQQSAPFTLSVSFKAPHVQDPNQYIYDPALANLYANDVIPDPVLGDPAFFNAQPAFLQNTEGRVRWNGRFSTPAMYQESIKSYYRLVTGVDNAVGDIMDKLVELGVDDNTIIIYTSDNGMYLGDRGFAGKWYAHEQSIGVPLIIHDPRNQTQQGTRRDQVALSVDMAPTILDYAGIDIPDAMQGVSLVPISEGQSPDWREEFFYEHHFVHSGIPKSEAIRTDRWKYISYVDNNYEELYDLSADPIEEFNLAGDAQFQSVLINMRAKLIEWRDLAENSDTHPLSVSVTTPGDFNNDGSVNALDWIIFRDNSRTDLSALTPKAAALLGDLDGDLDNDIDDFGLFRTAYEIANPEPMAFETMLANVPEPSSLALVGLGGLAIARRRRR